MTDLFEKSWNSIHRIKEVHDSKPRLMMEPTKYHQ